MSHIKVLCIVLVLFGAGELLTGNLRKCEIKPADGVPTKYNNCFHFETTRNHHNMDSQTYSSPITGLILHIIYATWLDLYIDKC